MNEITLKPCPFCGSPGEIEYIEACEDPYFSQCSNKRCIASYMEASFPTEKEAVEAWNERVIDEIPLMSRMGLVELMKQIYANFKQKYIDVDLNDEAYRLEIKEILSSFLEYATKEILNIKTDDEPVAFDKEKVIEELNNLKNSKIDMSDDEPELADVDSIYEEGLSQGEINAYIKAIEIVEKGGVSY